MAGLIPQGFIDDLLARADIVEVVGSRVTLKKTGKNYSALCPFHQEKSPSFSVEPGKQFYYCFGCGAGGNALGFIMNYENLEFPQAVESLAKQMGIEVPYEENPQQHRQREKKQTLYDVLEKAARFYQQQLRQHPERTPAIEYLKGRGLTGEVARDFGLGFAPAGWDNLLKALGDTDESRKLLVDSGLIIHKDNPRNPYHDRFRERIVFPIRDSRGRVIGFGGRVLGDEKPKYLNSPETPVFRKGEELYGLYEARQKNRDLKRFLIVEGYMDVISLTQHDVTYSVATLGTATSTSHLRRLFKLAPEVVFCFDGDEAGRAAAWRALEQTLPLMTDGLSARFLFLPDGEDPDTYIRKSGKSAFEQAVTASKPLAEFLFEHLCEQVNMDTLEGRARLSSLAMPLIRAIPDGVYHQLVLDQLSGLAGTDMHAFEPAPTSRNNNNPPPGPPPDRFPPAQTENRTDNRPGKADLSVCMKAVNLILLNPSVVNETDHTGLEEVQAQDIDLLLKVIAIASENQESNTPALLGRLYASPEGSKLIQLANREQITPAEGRSEEYAGIISSLKKKHQKKHHIHHLLEEARKRLTGNQ